MNNRPRISVPYQTLDLILELITITVLLVMIGFTVLEYGNLPDIIPTHFNGQGIADDYGNKVTVWLLPAIALIMYVGLFVLNKYPHLHNYMVNITQENALKNYRFSTRVLRIVNLFTMTILAVIALKIIEASKGNTFSLGTWFAPVIIGFSILLPLFLIIYMRKINKK